MTNEEINKFMGWFSHTQPTEPESLVVRVRKLVAVAVAEEREACAKLMDDMAKQDTHSNYYKVAAKAIRARGEA